MRSFLFAILLCVSAFSFADSPFPPYLQERFEVIEDMLGIGDGEYAPKVRAGFNSVRTVKAEYLPAVTGGGSATAYALGVSIPASSIIINSWYVVPSTIVNASNQTIAIYCESANDIVTAADMTSTDATGSFAGTVSANNTNSFRTDGCELYAQIGAAASGDITSGEVEVFVEYVKSAAGAGVAD